MPVLPQSARVAAMTLVLHLLYPAPNRAQLSDGAKAAILINNRYTVFSDLTYVRAGNNDLKLDLVRSKYSADLKEAVETAA